jgi:Uma2 family endonuclease
LFGYYNSDIGQFYKLVIEIVSPGARRRDMVKKLNVYLGGGIDEYWIADPKKHQVILYCFIDKQPETMIVCGKGDTVKSIRFEGLCIDVNDIFENI